MAGKVGIVEKYISLEVELHGNHEWVLLSQLHLQARIGIVESWVKTAIEMQNDEATKGLVHLLFLAIRDLWLLPHLDSNTGCLRDSSECRADNLRAYQAATEKALQLWSRLPHGAECRCVGCPQDCDELVMYKTRLHLLATVVGWMTLTQDEEESDRMLKTLLDIRAGFSLEAERKMVDDLVWARTDYEYPPARMLRHYLMVSEHPTASDLARIFAMGLAKCMPMENFRAAMSAYAREAAEETAKRDRAVQELIEKIELRPCYKGGVKVGFDSQQRLVLDVEVQEDPSHFPVPEDHIRQFKEYHAELCGYGTEWSLKQRREVLLYVKWGGLSYPSRV